MPVFLLIIVIAICLVLGLIAFAVSFDVCAETESCLCWSALFFLIGIPLLVWVIAAGCLPGVNTQIIVYTDQDNNQAVVNVNDILHGSIDPNSKVEVTEYKRDGYYGISYAGAETACRPTYKVVDIEGKVKGN